MIIQAGIGKHPRWVFFFCVSCCGSGANCCPVLYLHEMAEMSDTEMQKKCDSEKVNYNARTGTANFQVVMPDVEDE